MGACAGDKPINTSVPFGTSNLTTENSIISFRIPAKQNFADKILGVELTVISPSLKEVIYIEECHANREVKIDLREVFIERDLEGQVKRGTKLEYRLAYVYKQFKTNLSDVMTIEYSPSLTNDRLFRMNDIMAQRTCKAKIDHIFHFPTPNTKYHEMPALLNILLVGSPGSGKSLYLQEIFRILMPSQNLKLLIGPEVIKFTHSTTKDYSLYACNKLSNETRLINFIDTPGSTDESLETIRTVLKGRGSLKPGNSSAALDQRETFTSLSNNYEDFRKIIHVAILFTDCSNQDSIRTTDKLAQLLHEEQVMFVLALTKWERAFGLDSSLLSKDQSQKVTAYRFREYFERGVHKKIQEHLNQHLTFVPNSDSIFILNTKESQANNLHAKCIALTLFEKCLQLADGFYCSFPPLHIFYNEKLVGISHRYRANCNLQAFIQDVGFKALFRKITLVSAQKDLREYESVKQVRTPRESVRPIKDDTNIKDPQNSERKIEYAMVNEQELFKKIYVEIFLKKDENVFRIVENQIREDPDRALISYIKKFSKHRAINFCSTPPFFSKKIK